MATTRTVVKRARPARNAVVTATLTRPDDLVPVVDLCSHGSADAMADACARLGFLKVVNHGIPSDLVERLEAEALAFFSMPVQDKLTLRSDPGSSFRLGYGLRNIGANGDTGSLEYLLLSVGCLGPNFASTSVLPTALRYVHA